MAADVKTVGNNWREKMLNKGMSYTTDNSDLRIYVRNVYYIGRDYVKFKASLLHKKYGYHYETKTYKLPLDTVKRWRII